MDPSGEVWSDQNLIRSLEILRVLRATQCYPLFLAVLECAKVGDLRLAKLAQLCVIFTVRYSTICRKNPNVLEKLYSDGAALVREQQADGVPMVEKLLREQAPKDEEFELNFRHVEFKTNVSTAARYLLERLNYHPSDEQRAETTDKVHVEHIIPKKLNDEWRDFFDENEIDHDSVVSRLGNLTLLGSEYNRKISNSFFDHKRDYYAKSSFEMTKSLADEEKWDREALDARQAELAEKALDIWRIPDE